MSIGILLITHNRIGDDIVTTAQSILGVLPIVIKTIGITGDDDYPARLALAKQYVAELQQGDGVLILTDMYGATPGNIATQVGQAPEVRIVSGVNLPMLIRILNYPQLSMDAIIDKAISAGHDSIFDCSQPNGAPP